MLHLYWGSRMIIKCDCHKFTAKVEPFPKCSAGIVFCYCDDCQKYLKKIGRPELLDDYGGSEIIPVYPNNFVITNGIENLVCHSLSPNGLRRWTTSCCQTPIANTLPRFPWLGLSGKAVKNAGGSDYESLGDVRSRIMGKYKTSDAPFKISEKLSLKDGFVVLPFVVKGFLFKLYSRNPFFEKDGKTPISEVHILK